MADSSPAAAGQKVVVERLFDAPRELLFGAWTDQEQVKQWWGPHHFTNPRCEVDARPGGAIRIDMQGPDGVTHPMTGEFLEVEEPSRLVFITRAFEDEDGNAALEVRFTVTFVEQGGKTLLTLYADVITAEPLAIEALSGMEEGWKQSFEKLDTFLAG